MATIYDVAKKAGVSPKTVSRVLNGDAPVNVETRKAVRAAMGALSYVPSSAARSMRSNKTGLIGLMTGAISTSATSPEASGLPELLIVQSMQRVLSDAGMTPLIADTGGDPAKVADLARTFAQHRVEGLVYVADHHKKVSLPPIDHNAPLLLVNCFDSDRTPSVLPDDHGGQRALVAALIDAGHRRIGFLTLDTGLEAYRLRLDGYRDALAEAGIDYDPALIIPAGLHHAGPQEMTLIGDAVTKLLGFDHPPTVLCCGNDRMAMQLYGILRTRGIAVPEDISVAGYDDHRLISETLYPPLTTAVLPYREMGERAAARLIAQLQPDTNQPIATEPDRIAGDVVWRQSVTRRQQTPNPG